MIKKAVLLLILAPFLMVFSSNALAIVSCPSYSVGYSLISVSSTLYDDRISYGYTTRSRTSGDNRSNYCSHRFSNLTQSEIDFYTNNPLGVPVQTDEKCDSTYSGSSIPLSPSSANYLTSGGSYSAGHGTCKVSGRGSVCTEVSGQPTMCTVELYAYSSGEEGLIVPGIENEEINLKQFRYHDVSSEDDLDSSDFDVPEYLNPLPGQCSDNSSCVSIGDSSYLIDWDTAPEWFEYVGSDGQTYSKPQPDPTDPGDGNDGGSDGGGDVPGDNDSGGSNGGSNGGDTGDDTGGGSGGTGGDGGSDSDSDSSTGGSSGGSTGGSSGSGGSGGSSGGSTGGDSGGSSGGDSGGSSGGDSGGSTGDGEGGGEGEGEGAGWSPGTAESPWPEASEGDALIDAAQQRLDDLLDSIQSDMSSMFTNVSSAGGSCVNPNINFGGNNQELAYCEKIDQWSPSVKPAVLLIASIFAMFSLLRVRD